MGLIRKFSVHCDFCNNATEEHYSETMVMTEAINKGMVHMSKPFKRRDTGEIDWDVKWACVNSKCQQALKEWELDGGVVWSNGKPKFDEDKLTIK